MAFWDQKPAFLARKMALASYLVCKPLDLKELRACGTKIAQYPPLYRRNRPIRRQLRSPPYKAWFQRLAARSFSCGSGGLNDLLEQKTALFDQPAATSKARLV